MHDDALIKAFFWLIGLAAIGIIIAAIHFHATHVCVRSHKSECQTTTCIDYGNGLTICSPMYYTCDVCDEWRER